MILHTVKGFRVLEEGDSIEQPKLSVLHSIHTLGDSISLEVYSNVMVIVINNCNNESTRGADASVQQALACSANAQNRV